MEKSWWLFWCCNAMGLWWKRWWRWKHLNPWVVIDSTTNSGCWWSVLFLIWSCDIVLIISVTVIIFIIVMTLMMMPMMMVTWTLIMMTMMMVTCMGLSWTLYSFSSSPPRRPLPFALTGLKMQSSDLSRRDHVFCLFPFPFFVFSILSFIWYPPYSVTVELEGPVHWEEYWAVHHSVGEDTCLLCLLDHDRYHPLPHLDPQWIPHCHVHHHYPHIHHLCLPWFVIEPRIKGLQIDNVYNLCNACEVLNGQSANWQHFFLTIVQLCDKDILPKPPPRFGQTTWRKSFSESIAKSLIGHKNWAERFWKL